jgi:hypothetical protein
VKDFRAKFPQEKQFGRRQSSDSSGKMGHQMATTPKEDTVYIALHDLRGVPEEDMFWFPHWLLPARFVPLARAKGEITRFPGFYPICRVCGKTISKDNKQVVRFKFQETSNEYPGYYRFSPLGRRRNAYLHVHKCLPDGEEAPNTVTNRELRN